MDSYLRFGSAQQIPEYNCQIANFTKLDWERQGRRNIPTGLACLAFGITTQFLYIFALCALCKSTLLSLSCYKIMLALGCFDVIAISVNSILAGYYFLSGAVYCTYPELMYISGCIGFGLSLSQISRDPVGVWCGSSLTCLILVVNRLLDIWKPLYGHYIFKDDRTWFILLLPLFYSIGITYYSMPVLFNSAKYSFFFDPFIQTNKLLKYYSKMHVVNNLIVVVSTLILYFILLCVILSGFSSPNLKMSSNQKSILLQTTIICVVTMSVDLGCVYMQFVEPPVFLVIMVQITWMLAHGIPAYIYVLVNKRIRRSCAKMLKLRGSTGRIWRT